MFLHGASARANITGQTIPLSKIYGPMEFKKFYQPIVKLTGHPSLTIKWEIALNFLYFSESEAFAQLKLSVESYCQDYQLDISAVIPSLWCDTDFLSHLRIMSKRPGMYGIHKGWNIRCYLYGIVWYGSRR